MTYNKKITEKAYAKINLYLDVTKKRNDGFHDIKSIMQTVSLCDEITVSVTDKGDDVLTCDVKEIPTDKSNLALKAASLFKDAVGLSFGTEIHIKKEIPMAAGLAGGSTDAAAVLRILNRLTGAELPTEKLLEIAARIGADVPFCFLGGTRLCEGKGEPMKALPDCPRLHCVVAVKGEGVSTPWAYGELDALYGDFSEDRDHGRFSALSNALGQGDTNGIINNLYNIFESVSEKERPEIKKLKAAIMGSGAKTALMSGSGPSVFGIFEDEFSAKKAEKALREYGAAAYYCFT